MLIGVKSNGKTIFHISKWNNGRAVLRFDWSGRKVSQFTCYSLNCLCLINFKSIIKLLEIVYWDKNKNQTGNEKKLFFFKFNWKVIWLFRLFPSSYFLAKGLALFQNLHWTIIVLLFHFLFHILVAAKFFLLLLFSCK